MTHLSWRKNPAPQLTAIGLKTANNSTQDSKHSLTCHSGNYLLNCSVLIHVGHPEEFSPCLHYGWRMMMGHAPALRFSHCHYHCYCHCRSSATPPRNLLGKPDIISLKAVKLKPRKVYQLHAEKEPWTWWIQITHTAAGIKLNNTTEDRADVFLPVAQKNPLPKCYVASYPWSWAHELPPISPDINTLTDHISLYSLKFPLSVYHSITLIAPLPCSTPMFLFQRKFYSPSTVSIQFPNLQFYTILPFTSKGLHLQTRPWLHIYLCRSHTIKKTPYMNVLPEPQHSWGLMHLWAHQVWPQSAQQGHPELLPAPCPGGCWTST